VERPESGSAPGRVNGSLTVGPTLGRRGLFRPAVYCR
jgi:hypothetical protein